MKKILILLITLVPFQIPAAVPSTTELIQEQANKILIIKNNSRYKVSITTRGKFYAPLVFGEPEITNEGLLLLPEKFIDFKPIPEIITLTTTDSKLGEYSTTLNISEMLKNKEIKFVKGDNALLLLTNAWTPGKITYNFSNLIDFQSENYLKKLLPYVQNDTITFKSFPLLEEASEKADFKGGIQAFFTKYPKLSAKCILELDTENPTPRQVKLAYKKLYEKWNSVEKQRAREQALKILNDAKDILLGKDIKKDWVKV